MKLWSPSASCVTHAAVKVGDEAVTEPRARAAALSSYWAPVFSRKAWAPLGAQRCVDRMIKPFDFTLLAFLPKGEDQSDGVDGRCARPPDQVRALGLRSCSSKIFAATVRTALQEPFAKIIPLSKRGFVSPFLLEATELSSWIMGRSFPPGGDGSDARPEVVQLSERHVLCWGRRLPQGAHEPATRLRPQCSHQQGGKRDPEAVTGRPLSGCAGQTLITKSWRAAKGSDP